MELVAADKKYKQTEVGLIPEDWAVGALRREVGSLIAGVSVNSVNDIIDFDHDYAVLKTSAVFNGVFNPKECKKIAVSDLSRARLNPREDHIIISRMNTPDLVGECGYVYSNHPNLFIPDRLWLIELKKGNKLNTKWLSYILSYSPYRQKIRDIGSGTSGSMKNISKDKFLDILIPYPEKNEQTAIATALSDIGALIDGLEKLTAKKRSIKRGAMQKLLEPKEGWEMKIFGDLGEVDSENLGAETNPKYLFKYISLENVDKGVLTGVTEMIFGDAPSRARRKVKKGDILISTVRPNLKSHLYIKEDVSDWICSTGFSVLRCDNSIANGEYVFHHLFASLINRQIETLISGSNYPAINSKDVKSLKIPLPPLQEQTRIAAILSDIDAEIDALEVKLEKYRNIKQGMMQNLLTGKIRLV